MGYMTTITILNDGFDQIKQNPERFVENIQLGMNGINTWRKRERKINTYSVGNHCNPMEVAQSHHADEARLYLVYQNMMTTFGWANDLEDIKLRKRLLEEVKFIIEEEERKIKELENTK